MDAKVKDTGSFCACLHRCAAVGAIIAWAWAGVVSAATFHVSMTGNDANPGTLELPWRTIQQAAATMVAGDTVRVAPGSYDERITTVRAGSAGAGRIRFVADGAVIVKGWVISHAYITIEGFDITGWSATGTNDGHIRVNGSGDYFEMIDCTMRDTPQIVRTDMRFVAATSTIESEQGGFLDAGFAPGQFLYVGRGAFPLTVRNLGNHIISHVTDTRITVAGALQDDGPLPVYLSAALVFGIWMHPSSSFCVFRGNRFSNLGYDTLFIRGSNHLLESNIVERVNGWDALHFGGSGHIFRHNFIGDSPLRIYQVSPDAMENWPANPYTDVTFSNNFFYGFAGVLASQKGSESSSGLLLTHNVFVDVGGYSLTHPGTTIKNNTFVRAGKVNNEVIARRAHPILIYEDVGATNMIIRNNVFVDCGEPLPSQTEADVGWYQVIGSLDALLASHNFVAGAPPTFVAKPGFNEGNPSLNGGDPGFVDLWDPLGPDGLPFTDDDGLWLIAGSKLIGAGDNGTTIGAYGWKELRPFLLISSLPDHQVRLAWPAAFEGFALQHNLGGTGAWQAVLSSPVLEGDMNVSTNPAGSGVEFFRLIK